MKISKANVPMPGTKTLLQKSQQLETIMKAANTSDADWKKSKNAS